MDKRSMHALEYDKIRQRLAGYCVNDGAKETALALEPESDRSEISRQLGFTDEALEMSLRSGRMPMSKPAGACPPNPGGGVPGRP